MFKLLIIPVLISFFLFSTNSQAQIGLPEGGPILATFPYCIGAPTLWTIKYNYATKLPQTVLYTQPSLFLNYIPTFPGVTTLGKYIPGAFPCVISVTPPVILWATSFEYYYGDAIGF